MNSTQLDKLDLTKENSQIVKILHFSDAHIDIANYGKHDPVSGLPVRVMDFLSALDQVIEAALNESVDLVIFAGDAYKDRNPQPTFQREWGERIMRLSRAGITTILLVGNHDVSPSAGRATTIQEFSTLNVPNVIVADKIQKLGFDRLRLPLEVITIPWISPNALMARDEISGKTPEDVMRLVEDRIGQAVEEMIESSNPDLPLILTAHASVQGAKYGSEKTVMLGQELIINTNILRDYRLDYVGLGHIHKHQELNHGEHPPIIYSGSIERINFGEVKEKKGFVLAEIGRGFCRWQFKETFIRPHLDLSIDTPSAESFMEDIVQQLPEVKKIEDAICRIKLTYPRDWEPLLNESIITNHFQPALSLQIVKNRELSNRSRLGDTVEVESLSKAELLEQYWETIGLEASEVEALQSLATEVLFTE